jgi:hypothetical protein
LREQLSGLAPSLPEEMTARSPSSLHLSTTLQTLARNPQGVAREDLPRDLIGGYRLVEEINSSGIPV